jgi:hypothetical protein
VEARFEQFNQRFEQVDTRFEQIDKRFDRIDSASNTSFARLHRGCEDPSALDIVAEQMRSERNLAFDQSSSAWIGRR